MLSFRAAVAAQTQRVPAAPFVFCSGAAMRGSAGAVSGLLCIDAASLSLPQVQRLIATALLPLMSHGETVQSKQRRSQTAGLEQQQQRVALPKGAELLVRGLAAHGPPKAAAFFRKATERDGRPDPVGDANEDAGLHEEAAVAVLLLLARADLSTLSPDRPSLLALLCDSSVGEVTSELRAVAAGAASSDSPRGPVRPHGSAPVEARKATTRATENAVLPDNRGASWGLVGPYAAEGCCAGWLRLLLCSLCCCLQSVPFASRALAARALASYVIQIAQTQGAQCLIEAVAATATVAARAYELAQTEQSDKREHEGPAASRAGVAAAPSDPDEAPECSNWRDANARSGLLLLLLELLGRPEASSLLAEVAGDAVSAGLFAQVQHSAMKLQIVVAAPFPALERVLAMQAMHALAVTAPAEHQEALWGLAAATTRVALGITRDETQIDTAKAAEVAHGRVSFVYHVGLPAVQVVALRILVHCHLGPVRETDAVKDPTRPAAQTYLRGLNSIAAILRAALALAVHPQAVEEALLTLAKATDRHTNAQQQRLHPSPSLTVNSSSEAPAVAYAGGPEETAEEPCAQTMSSFFAIWEICLQLLENPLTAESVSASRNFWKFCYLAPLQIAACLALAALAVFAASSEPLCREVCREQSGRAAAAAQALLRADVGSERAGAAWTRLGAALLLCAENDAARQYGKGARCGSEGAHAATALGPGVCFGHPSNRWAAVWASGILRCSQPTQELATRVDAAKVSDRCPLGCHSRRICFAARAAVYNESLVLEDVSEAWLLNERLFFRWPSLVLNN